MFELYDQELPRRLYAGDVDECFQFLDARRHTDGHMADYWHWRAVTHLRAGEFLQALDLCLRLTRQANGFAFHVHCLVDACLHLGLKEVALAAVDSFASKPATPATNAFLWRIFGWHYLGEDHRVAELSAEGFDESATYTLGHHQARGRMRHEGIARGIEGLHRFWSSPEARRVLYPDKNIDHYWSGQRALPARLKLRVFASGIGDMVNWARYLVALEAMGVELIYDRALFCLEAQDDDRASLADKMRAAGFTRAPDDGEMWTDPFALFTSLFPVLGFLPWRRSIAPSDSACAQPLIDELWHRARGRRCVGIFWSSCESANNFASRSLRLADVTPLFDATEDIFWVVMQRGFEHRRWLADPRAADRDRFMTLTPDTTFAQSVALIDKLDAFVGNDGSLIHFAGALGKRAYLMLNQVAEWRYENAPDTTAWYPSVRLIRAPELGAWGKLIGALRETLVADLR